MIVGEGNLKAREERAEGEGVVAFESNCLPTQSLIQDSKLTNLHSFFVNINLNTFS